MYKLIVNTTITLLIAIAGAGAAFVLHLPMPFLLGAILAVSVAALCGASVLVPESIRLPMFVVFGLLLGSTITPGLLHAAWLNLPLLLMQIPYVVFVVIVLFVGLRKFGGFDPATAFFSAVPGGLNEMILLGRHYNADERALAVHQTVRLFLTIVVAATAFQLSTGTAMAQLPQLAHFASPADYGIQLAVGLIGAGVAFLFRLPAGVLLGPLILNAFVHVTGFSAARPDPALTLAAQVIVGASIGQRFALFAPAELATAARTAVISTALLLALSATAAGIGALISGYPFPLLFLSFSPAGIAEMGLIALLAGYDAGFVTVMQVGRYILSVGLAAGLFRILRKY